MIFLEYNALEEIPQNKNTGRSAPYRIRTCGLARACPVRLSVGSTGLEPVASPV